MITLPPAFEAFFRNLYPDQWPSYVAALEKPAPTSIRLNPRKPTDLYNEQPSVAWHKAGRYLSERPVFALDPAFHTGAYYVQEAASMAVARVFEQITDRNQPVRVLDLCAAPGGKSTAIIDLLTSEDLMVVNEVIKSRIGPLKENIEKWGFENVIVLNQDPEELVELEGYFDVVLVDAPCSGEGLFRKQASAVNEWSPESVDMCSARQRRILQAAAMLVKPQGHLIYSTCTFNLKENDENCVYFTSHFDFEKVEINFDPAHGAINTRFGQQFIPGVTLGEGFFVAAFKKTFGDDNQLSAGIRLNKVPNKLLAMIGSWLDKSEAFNFYFKSDLATVVAIPKHLNADYGTVFKATQRRSSGFEIGMIKGQDLIPSHALALSGILSKSIAVQDLTIDQALSFLKRETLETAVFEEKEGWVLATYLGHGLGWVKVLENRINNYLPKEWRLRMDV